MPLGVWSINSAPSGAPRSLHPILQRRLENQVNLKRMIMRLYCSSRSASWFAVIESLIFSFDLILQSHFLGQCSHSKQENVSVPHCISKSEICILHILYIHEAPSAACRDPWTWMPSVHILQSHAGQTSLLSPKTPYQITWHRMGPMPAVDSTSAKPQMPDKEQSKDLFWFMIWGQECRQRSHCILRRRRVLVLSWSLVFIQSELPHRNDQSSVSMVMLNSIKLTNHHI